MIRRIKINDNTTYVVLKENKGSFNKTFYHDLELLVYVDNKLFAYWNVYNTDSEVTDEQLKSWHQHNLVRMNNSLNQKRYKEFISFYQNRKAA